MRYEGGCRSCRLVLCEIEPSEYFPTKRPSPILLSGTRSKARGREAFPMCEKETMELTKINS